MTVRTFYTFQDEPRLTVYRFRENLGGKIPGSAPETDKTTIRHAIDAYGFLIPRNKELSGPDFAAQIRDYCNNERARLIASTVAKY